MIAYLAYSGAVDIIPKSRYTKLPSFVASKFPAHTSKAFSELNHMIFRILKSCKYFFSIMKVNDYWGDLTECFFKQLYWHIPAMCHSEEEKNLSRMLPSPVALSANNAFSAQTMLSNLNVRYKPNQCVYFS